MTDTAHYIIQKQILDVRHGKRGNAYAKQTEISTRYQKEVLPMLEKICRELCPKDRLIKIDRLVVDLPHMTESNYRTKWIEEVVKSFRQSLSHALLQAEEAQHSDVEVLRQTDADLQLLTSFLYTGTMHWSYTESQNRSLETIFSELLATEEKAVRRLLTKGLKQESFTKRLCYQFSIPLLAKLITLLQPTHAAEVRDCYKTLYHCFEKADYFSVYSDAAFLLNYYSLRTLAEHPYQNEKQFTRRVLRQISQRWGSSYWELLNNLFQYMKQEAAQYRKTALFFSLEALYKEVEAKYKSSSVHRQQEKQQEQETEEYPFQKEWQQLLLQTEQFINASAQEKKMLYKGLKKRLDEFIHLTENRTKGIVIENRSLAEDVAQLLRKLDQDSGARGSFHEEIKILLERLLKNINQQQKTRRNMPEGPEDALHPEAIYLQNAGLVIIWPFLTQLFEALKLTEKKRFTSEEKQFRAVHLLQYLATGAEGGNEHLLPLNKLLCGLSLEEPVPKQLALPEVEKESAEDLIKAAIDHWPMMKNTSVEGFREAFLIREGKLSRSSNGWLLQVEQRSYDIIMDKLPWALSLVKLPWMPEVLFVEW